MGVPHLFAHLVRAYPTIIKPLPEVGPVSRLYLDFNSLIHPVAAQHFDDGDEAAIIKDTCTYMNTVRAAATPTMLTYIGIDGAPVFAKMQQQRRRRHLSVFLNKLAQQSAANAMPRWDRNAISPGTAFMDKLSVALKQAAARDPTLIISDDREFGEGEHKIMQHLREDTPDLDVGAVVIYGLDADLIILSLLSSARKVFLMREPMHFNMEGTGFMYLDVDALREAVSKTVVDDMPSYAAMVSLLGNDFLPPISAFRLRRDGMPTLLASYAAARRITGERHLVTDGAISVPFLKAMLAHLEPLETKAMHSLHEWYVRASPPSVLRPGSSLQEFYPVSQDYKKVLPLFSGDWRANYDRWLLPGKGTPEDAAKTFLEGLQWNLAYYLKGYKEVDVRRWHYPFSHGPLVRELVRALPDTPTLPIHVPRPEDTVPYGPAQCLALILPRESSGLLPEAVRSVVTNPLRGCAHMYPTTYVVETYLRGFLHECVPLLPYMDVEPILAEVPDSL